MKGTVLKLLLCFTNLIPQCLMREYKKAAATSNSVKCHSEQ